MHAKSLLIIEDDVAFASVLAKRLERHDFVVEIAHHVENGLHLAVQHMPNYVLLDMKIGEHNGIHILPQLRKTLPQSRIILLTGYASIATAVDAIKSGADDYLTKPVDGSTLLATLLGKPIKPESASLNKDFGSSLTPGRVEWEHIQQVLKANDGNVSATARQLNMHRRTLQRKLAKKPQN